MNTNLSLWELDISTNPKEVSQLQEARKDKFTFFYNYISHSNHASLSISDNALSPFLARCTPKKTKRAKRVKRYPCHSLITGYQDYTHATRLKGLKGQKELKGILATRLSPVHYTRHRQNLKTTFFILLSALVCLTLPKIIMNWKSIWKLISTGGYLLLH